MASSTGRIKKLKNISSIGICMLFTLNIHAQTDEKPVAHKFPEYYLFVDGGISTNRPIIESISPNVRTEINYSLERINKFCLSLGVGLKTKRDLVYELSFSKAAIGTNLIVRNIFDSLNGGDLPVQYSNYYTVWSGKFSFGYNFKMKDFTLTPLIGIGKPLNPNSHNRSEGKVSVEDKWHVTISNDSKFINTGIYSAHVKLPIGYSFSRKKKRFIDVCYTPCISFSNTSFVYDRISFSTGNSEYIINTANRGNYISHTILIVYSLNSRIAD